MYSTIDRFASNGLITRDDAETARDAEASGTDAHTIGYEVEVLPSARQDISRAAKIESNDELYWKCTDKLEPYGYQVGCDGVYELQSPASRHAHALAVATRGLANYGWLPKKGSKGLVTSHVSIGTSEDLDRARYDGTLEELVTTLRAVEMFGGTTPTRLAAPLKIAREMNDDVANYSWSQKGDYGVKIVPVNQFDRRYIDWQGDNNRIEFRTLGYYNPKQFGAMLNAVYYLTRGIFTSNESASGTYGQYYFWIRDYFASNNLPDINVFLKSNETQTLDNYLTPYIRHLAEADLTDVRNETSKAIRNLKEEFHTHGLPLDDSHLVDVDTALPFRN